MIVRPSWLIFGLCFASFCVYKVYSIQCFVCESHKSWQDCNNNARKANCSKHFDQCMQQYEYKVFVNGTKKQNTESYKRGCAERNHCKDLDDFCTKYDMRCIANCCQKDFCNGYNSAICLAGFHYLVACLFSILYIIH